MKNIVLVGFMGTGKTAVARELARRLKREFVSLDELIEKKENRPIIKIFAESGENYFRDVESQVVKEVSGKENLVIDVGGGVVVREENVANLKKKGILICLKASPEVILERTKHAKHRPLLNVPNPKEKIQELLNKRAPYYSRADYSVDTSDLSIQEVVEKTLEIIHKE
jgi:shikimate kinase